VSDFKDFFKSAKTENNLLSKSDSEIAIAHTIATSAMSLVSHFGSVSGSNLNKEKEKFSAEVSKLAHSDDFIETLSKDIGKPRDSESEDEFVDRAKRTMKDLLRKKLSK
jgi:hypothetical protein